MFGNFSKETAPMIRAFILRCLDDQFFGRDISWSDHKQLIKMVDAGLLGMDGFKYCAPEVAKENWRRCHIEKEKSSRRN